MNKLLSKTNDRLWAEATELAQPHHPLRSTVPRRLLQKVEPLQIA